MTLQTPSYKLIPGTLYSKRFVVPYRGRRYRAFMLEGHSTNLPAADASLVGGLGVQRRVGAVDACRDLIRDYQCRDLALHLGDLMKSTIAPRTCVRIGTSKRTFVFAHRCRGTAE